MSDNGRQQHIAIITAGGAGMFCGSCMHDNTWARALRAAGAEVTLLPTYTPIRVDEDDLSASEVFFGGVNVYLDYAIPLWSRIPRGLTRWLDSPRVLGLATKFSVSNNAQKLGPLTLAMLSGEMGPQRTHVEELAAFLSKDLKPDIVCFSNALLVGALRRLREQFTGRIFCTLQGDDVFLEDLAEPHRTQALELIRERAREFDGFLVHSRYYRDFMAEYLQLPIEKIHVVPLGIDFKGHDGSPDSRQNERPTVGYFARICHEKGLHKLVEAFGILHARRPEVRLKVGGYLGKQNRRYFRDIERTARAMGDAFEYHGSPSTHAEKVELLRSFDVLSVPTVYREPKGLYVLEALANGVPVVQPRHGAFPELVEATGGGLLVDPANPGDLASGLEELLYDADQRLELAKAGHANVRAHYSAARMAEATLEIFRDGQPAAEAVVSESVESS